MFPKMTKVAMDPRRLNNIKISKGIDIEQGKVAKGQSKKTSNLRKILETPRRTCSWVHEVAKAHQIWGGSTNFEGPKASLGAYV